MTAAATSAQAPTTTTRGDLIARVLDSLVAERQHLRSSQTERALLEANRLAIVYWQNELVRELGKSHGRSKQAALAGA